MIVPLIMFNIIFIFFSRLSFVVFGDSDDRLLHSLMYWILLKRHSGFVFIQERYLFHSTLVKWWMVSL